MAALKAGDLRTAYLLAERRSAIELEAVGLSAGPPILPKAAKPNLPDEPRHPSRTREYPLRYPRGRQVTDVYPTVFEQAGAIMLGWLHGIAWQARARHHARCNCPRCTEVMIGLIGDLGRLQRPPHMPEVRPS